MFSVTVNKSKTLWKTYIYSCLDKNIAIPELVSARACFCEIINFSAASLLSVFKFYEIF